MVPARAIDCGVDVLQLYHCQFCPKAMPGECPDRLLSVMVMRTCELVNLSDVRWLHLPSEIKSSFPALVVIASNLLLNLVYVVVFFGCLFELFYNAS